MKLNTGLEMNKKQQNEEHYNYINYIVMKFGLFREEEHSSFFAEY